MVLSHLVLVPRPETSVLFTIYLVPYFSHFLFLFFFFFTGNFIVSNSPEMQGGRACSVSEPEKATLCLMEKISLYVRQASCSMSDSALVVSSM